MVQYQMGLFSNPDIVLRKYGFRVIPGIVLCTLTRDLGGPRVAQGIDEVERIMNFLRCSDIFQFWHVKMRSESSYICLSRVERCGSRVCASPSGLGTACSSALLTSSSSRVPP